MARLGRFDMSGLKEFQRKLEKIDQEAIDGFLEDCAKELAARLLRKVIKRLSLIHISEPTRLL